MPSRLLRAVLTGLLAAALLSTVGHERLTAQETPAASRTTPAGKTVELTLDYGDGAELRFKALPWRAGMTVFDALTAAAAHPHGVKFRHRGAGSTTLVTQIADLKNEGGGRTRKNWIFSVGGKLSTVGAGQARLKPADRILWKFAVYDYNPQ